MIAAAVLAAVDVGTLIKFLILLLFILVPSIWRMLTQAQNLGRPAPQRPPRNVGVQQQIEEFLQRAAERRGVGQPAVAPPPPTAPAAEPVLAEFAADEPVGGRLQRRVQEDINTSEFRRRGDQMGGEVAQSDKDFQQGVGKAFSPEVGRLATRPGETAMPVDTTTQETEENMVTAAAEAVATSTLGGLLNNPESLISAIVLNEILRRPEWE